MIARCYNPKSELYERYGRQGITVCQRWRSSYQAFASDMGPKPSPSHTLERIDGTKGYEPGNVRWATRFEQVMNQRIRSDNTSGFRGVSRRRNYWKAAIWFEETQIYIGLFKTAEEAAYVRDQFALELHGSAAYLNVL